jgi:hypothetical protein
MFAWLFDRLIVFFSFGVVLAVVDMHSSARCNYCIRHSFFTIHVDTLHQYFEVPLVLWCSVGVELNTIVNCVAIFYTQVTIR